MSFIYDKHIRYYCIFLLGAILFLFFTGMYIADRQTVVMKEMLISHDNAIASSLLEQGVSKDIIATALTNEEISSEGSKFLATMGLSNKTDVNRLSYVVDVQDKILPLQLGAEIIFSVFIIFGAFVFLYSRERLYKKSESIIKSYIDGNYDIHLPQTSDGTIYQMLASVDQLAKISQSKNDTDRKSREFLRNTISDISHQLKTPLAALMMYQEIIENEPDNPVIVKEFSIKIDSALKRMEQLIYSMMKITRLDTGNIVFEKKHYNVSNIVHNAINELTTRASNENKEIIVEGDLTLMLFCDMEWTSEAIGNIVKNALDHTVKGGKIHILLERTPAMIRISISDNGHGIAPEDIHHIFKRFYRSKKTSETQGLGLGLPLAKAIIDGQGGIISVRSDCSQGTTFTLSFLTES